MTGNKKGVGPPSGFGLFTLVQMTCLLLVSMLGLWWGLLLSRQHGHLQKLNGLVPHPIDLTSLGTNFERMVFWEGTFFVAVVALTLVLSGLLYWREVKRIRTLEIFFASMTHELKTPLASIRLQAEAIGESVPSDHKGYKWVGRLLQDVNRLEHQVGNTLELARLTGGGDLFLEEIDLRETLEDVARTWLPTFEQQLKVNWSHVEGIVKADRQALIMIANNIIGNAVKHSGRSPVTLTAKTEYENGALVLHMQDDGAACSDGVMDEALKLFERVGKTAGTGVGLYLVQSLMHKMGGGVRLSNRGGFSVALHFSDRAKGEDA